MSKKEKDTNEAYQEVVEIPSDPEAEKYLLGNLLFDPKLLLEVLGKLKSDDFYLTAHRRIFDAFVDLHNEGAIIDILAIPAKLKEQGVLESVGGSAYIASLLDSGLGLVSLSRCIQKIKEASLRRKTLRSTNFLTSLITDKSLEWREILNEINKTVEIANEVTAERALPKLIDLAFNRLSFVEELARRGNELIGVTTGYRALDRLTLGLQNSDLIVVGARPGCGKSALALNIATNAAAKGKSIAFFSLEMSAAQLTDRLLCSIAHVDLHTYKSGYLNREEWTRLNEALSTIQDYKITIVDSTELTPTTLRSECLRIKKQLGLDLIVVDYLQLMQADNPKKERYQEIGQISRGLKRVAKDLNLPILALAQISREVEKRGDSKPKLSDLREGGDIEQDSDVVWFLHQPAIDPDVAEDSYPTVSLLIEKHRNGPTGKVDFVFLKEFTRFELKES